MPTINTTSRPRMAAIYAPGTVRAPLARRGRHARLPSALGLDGRADLADIHPITGRALQRVVWWIIETKE